MNKVIPLSVVSWLVATLSLPASANVHYDYAQVVRVKPIYEYVTIVQPYQQCQRVKQRSRRHRHEQTNATLSGALIGGVIGNVIGDNRHSTVAGAVIGGAIGHNAARHSHRPASTRHCTPAYQHAKKVRKIKGYRVKYRYQGAAYKAFMQNHPGDTVKVRVAVSPAGYD